jgi:hypothetical protein
MVLVDHHVGPKVAARQKSQRPSDDDREHSSHASSWILCWIGWSPLRSVQMGVRIISSGCITTYALKYPRLT